MPDSCKLHGKHVVNPGCVPATGEEVEHVASPGRSYPDLVPDVRTVHIERPVYWDAERLTLANGPLTLHFDSWAQNLGTVPVELMVDDIPTADHAPVTQCVAWTTDFVCRERVRVGGFVWHDEHRHFHYEDFASYELRRLGADGRPDYSPAGLLDQSEKVSFCLMDSAQVDPAARPVGTYNNNCAPVRQGISPGWADIYGEYLPGQQFDIERHGDGRYALIVSLDPANHLYESDDSRNVVEVVIDVTNNAQTATIVDRFYP